MVGWIQQQFVRFRGIGFIAIGGSVLALQLLATFMIVEGLRWDKFLTYILVGFVGVELNFWLTKSLTWSDMMGSLWQQWKRVHAFRYWTFALNCALWIFMDTDGLLYLRVSIVLAAIEAGIHFGLSHYFGFKE